MSESYPLEGDGAAVVDSERAPAEGGLASDGLRGFRHAFNNPLTALLAEAQLLEMDEELPAHARASAQRILELARRLVAVTRELEADANTPRIG